MIVLTHAAVGYLFSKTYCDVLKMDCGSNSLFTAATIIASTVSDLDGLFGKKINQHRNTIFHTPLFWLGIVLVLFLISFLVRSLILQSYIVAISLGIFSHLFLDWFSGRTIGIRLFYPFSKKMYSLFPLRPKLGDIPLIPNKKYRDQYIRFIRFYFNNVFLAISELMILAITFYVLIFRK